MSDLNQTLTFDASQALQSLGKLSKSLAQASAALKNFGNSATKAGTDKFTTTIDAYAGALGKLQLASQQGMDTGAAKALDTVGNSADKAGQSAKKATGSVKQFSGALSALAGVAKFASGILVGQLAFRAVSTLISQFKEAISSALQLSRAIGEIQTIANGDIGSSSQVADQIRDISTALGTSTANVAEGYYQTLSNQVVEAGDAFTFLAEAQKLASVTLSSTTASVQALSSVMNSYGESAGSASQVSDQLFKSVELGRLRLEEIGNIMGRVTPLASQLGVSVEELMAAIVTMTRQGVKANTAITQMRAVLLKLIKPGEELQGLFQEWGVADAQEAIHVYGGFEGVLKKIMESTEGSTARTGELFNRVRALAGVLALNVEGGSRYSETLKEIEESSGSVNKALKILDQSIGRQHQKNLQELKNRWQEMAESTLPFLNKTLRTLNKLFGLGSDEVDTYQEELRKLTEQLQEEDFAEALKEGLEEIDEQMEVSAKALANYTKIWNTMPNEVEASSKKMEAIVESLGNSISKTSGELSEALKKSLSGGFDDITNKSKEQLESLDDLLQDHKEKMELAGLPDDQKIVKRHQQLTGKLKDIYEKLGKTTYGTEAFNKLVGEGKEIATELLNIAQKAKEEGSGFVYPTVTNVVEDLKKYIDERSKSFQQLQEAIEKDPATRAAAKSALEKIAEVEATKKEIADLVTKQENLTGEDSKAIDARLENLKKKLEGIEFTPVELEILANMPVEDIDKKLADYLANIKNFSAEVPIEFVRVKEALEEALKDQAAKVRTQLGPGDKAIIDELTKVAKGVTPDALKKANKEIWETSKQQLRVQIGIKEATKNVEKAIREIELGNQTEPGKKYSVGDIFNEGSYQGYYNNDKRNLRPWASDEEKENAAKVRESAEKIAEYYTKTADTIRRMNAYQKAFGQAIPADKMAKLTSDVTGLIDSGALSTEAADFLTGALKNTREVNKELKIGNKLAEEYNKDYAKESGARVQSEFEKRTQISPDAKSDFEYSRGKSEAFWNEEDKANFEEYKKSLREAEAKTEAMRQGFSKAGTAVPVGPAQFLAAAMLGAVQPTEDVKTDLEETSSIDAKKPVEDLSTAIASVPPLETSLDELANFDATPLTTLTETLNTLSLTTNNISTNFATFSESLLPIGDASVNITEMATAMQGLPESVSASAISMDQLGPAIANVAENMKTAFGDDFTVIADNIKTVHDPISKLPGLLSNAISSSGTLRTSAVGVKDAIATWPGAVQAIIPAIQQAITAMRQLEAAAKAALQAANAAAASSTSSARYGRYFASGGSSRGLDTINARLSKGEFVVNAGATRKFYSELVAMNAGQRPAYREQGGSVTNVGDVNVSVQGQDTPRQTIREIAHGLRRELKRGTIQLR